MKNTKRIIYGAILVVLLVATCVVCFIVGRGHTVYLDNKSIEGTEYSYYECIEVFQKGNKITELYKKERGVVTVTGQKCKLTLEIQKKKNSMDYDTVEVEIPIPYGIDNVVINLPAYLEGATEDIYMDEFVPLVTDTGEDEEIDTGDEFDLGE